MIEWLYYSTLDLSLLLLLILLIRKPVRRLLGAHISYLLWLLPVMHTMLPMKFNRPELITRHIQLPSSAELTPLYTQPEQMSQAMVTTLTVVWLLGLCTWLLIKTINWIQFNRLLAQHASHIPIAQLAHLLPEQPLPPAIQCFKLKHNSGPLITGLWRPRIFLPAQFFQHYTTAQQCLMLQHEITHAKRRDLWAQLLAEVFRALFWFNPLIHLASKRFHEDQELACDYQVLKLSDPDTRLAYGQALRKGMSAHLMPPSLSFFHHPQERFLMLSKHQNNAITNLLGLLFTAAIAYLLLTQTMFLVKPKDTAVHGPLVSYEFKQIPLSAIVMLVADASGSAPQISGLETLNNTLITAKADQVHAYDLIDTLLEKHRFKMLRQSDSWQINNLK